MHAIDYLKNVFIDFNNVYFFTYKNFKKIARQISLFILFLSSFNEEEKTFRVFNVQHI